MTGLAAMGSLWNLGYGVITGMRGVVGEISPATVFLVSLSVIFSDIALIYIYGAGNTILALVFRSKVKLSHSCQIKVVYFVFSK